MEVSYTDEFDRQGTVYYVTDAVPEQAMYAESDSDSMSTCSSQSARTITSSEVSDFYQERFGRVFPLDDNIPVVLPIDEPEHERLSKQHRYLKLLVGSNHFGPFREVMERHTRPRVLDIRTQEGSWIQEVADEFPHAEFISLDVVPMVPHIPRPNVTFEVYDLYAGLAEPDESFDIIHARDCLNSIRNYDHLLREFHRVLRPGGLLLIGELGQEAYEAWDTSVPARSSAPQTARGLEIIRQAVGAQGVMLDAIPNITRWLEAEGAIWSMAGAGGVAGAGMELGTSPLTPPSGQPLQIPSLTTVKRGFHTIVKREAHIPNGTWHPDPVMQRVGAMAHEVWKATWLSCVPLLLEHNLSKDEVKEILEGAMKELCDPAVHTVWKYTMVSCYKI